MEYNTDYKSNKTLNSGLKISSWKKKMLFNTLRVATLILLSIGFTFLSKKNQQLYLLEIIIAHIILIPLIIFKMTSENSTIDAL